jgi:CBS domain-containing protein
MMQAQNTGCIVVVDVVEDGAPAGIITERDMVLGCLIDGHTSWKCQVYRHMTILNEAATPLTDIGNALLIMMESEVSYLPVVNESGSVVGLLYAEDLSRAIEQDSNPIAMLDGDLITV